MRLGSGNVERKFDCSVIIATITAQVSLYTVDVIDFY